LPYKISHAMDNKGNNLTQDILKNWGFVKEVFRDRNDTDEVKIWYIDGTGRSKK